MTTKYKVSELEGALLDAAVAKAQGWERDSADRRDWWWSVPGRFRGNPANSEGLVERFIPSRDWSQAGPIIERERISLDACPDSDPAQPWLAAIGRDYEYGQTPLIAAMRAYVASKFGLEVDL